MTDKTKLVIEGYLNLSREEKEDFVKEINDYINGNHVSQENFSEGVRKSINSIVLGPTGGSCPCCGR